MDYYKELFSNSFPYFYLKYLIFWKKSLCRLGRSIPSRGSLSANLDIAQSLPTTSFMSPNKEKNKFSRRRANQQSRSFSETDDTMFDIEGFHQEKDCEPFFESDEDSSGEWNFIVVRTY